MPDQTLLRFQGIAFDFFRTLAFAPWKPRALHRVLRSLDVEIPGNLVDNARVEAFAGRQVSVDTATETQWFAWEQMRYSSMLMEAGYRENQARGLGREIACRMRREHPRELLCLAPDAVQVLSKLFEATDRIAVCSNWAWDLAEVCEKLELTPYLSAVVSSASVGAHKPHPAIYASAAAKLGLAPRDICFVGNSVRHDVIGPVRYGMAAFLVSNTVHRLWPQDHRPPQIGAGRSLTDALAWLSTPPACPLKG